MAISRSLKVILIVAIMIIGIFAWLGYFAIREGFDVSRTPLPLYNSLFNEETQAQLLQPYVFKSKIREPESNYNIAENFHLTVYRLLLKDAKPLNQIVKIKDVEVKRSYEVYSPYADNSQLKMTKTSDKVGKIVAVNFNYRGDLESISKNDTLACYYLNFDGFSISYDDNSDNDIWAQSQTTKKDNTSVAFIKKANYLYIVLLFKNANEDQAFEPDRLYKMLNK